MTRVTSRLWVDAYVRRIAAEGNYGCVVKRGAESAGAIFIILNHLNGQYSLYGPAPQSLMNNDGRWHRLFSELISRQEESVLLARMQREEKFDSDLWIVENEDRHGRSFLDIAAE